MLLVTHPAAPGTRRPRTVSKACVTAERSPWSTPFPPEPPPRIARHNWAGSPVLRGGPTPRHRSCGTFGCCLLPPDWSAPRVQRVPRSPGSCACSFSACSGSSTTQGRPVARVCAAGRVAFPLCPQGRRLKLVLRSSIPCPPMPLSTLPPPPHDGARKTQGQDDSLLFSCRTLSFPTTCRFIPAHGHLTRRHRDPGPSLKVDEGSRGRRLYHPGRVALHPAALQRAVKIGLRFCQSKSSLACQGACFRHR